MVHVTVFIFLHRAWHSPERWNRLVTELDKSGCSSVAPALPFSGSTLVILDWIKDVEAIRDTVSTMMLSEHNKPKELQLLAISMQFIRRFEWTSMTNQQG